MSILEYGQVTGYQQRPARSALWLTYNSRLLLVILYLLYSNILVSQPLFCSHSLRGGSSGHVHELKHILTKRASRSRFQHTLHRQQRQEDQVVIDESYQSATATGREQQTKVRPGESNETRAGCQSWSIVGMSSMYPSKDVGLDENCNSKVIETAIFLDQALDNRFNGVSNGLAELNKLVMTTMNQVQRLFLYSSIKIPIRIKLVLVEQLRDGEKQTGLKAPDSAQGDIDVYLSNFCNWQQERLRRDKRLWWDHAILLSGLDLYKATPGRNHSGVLGLAWVGGMCKGNYSCTINEATNLESAFVIAHEIGHSLGIMHDGQRNNCDPNGFIMSEKTGAGKVHWSRCSNNYLSESIKRGHLLCLDNEQAKIKTSESLYDLDRLRPPGQVYTINDQCRLAFGANYSSFVTRQAPFNAVCRELWCVSGSWARAAHPALEGSSCGGSEQVCLEGKCATIGLNGGDGGNQTARRAS